MAEAKAELEIEYVLDDGILNVSIKLGETTILIEDNVAEPDALPTLVGSLPQILDRVWDSIEDNAQEAP